MRDSGGLFASSEMAKRRAASVEVARRHAESAGIFGPAWRVIEAIVGHEVCYLRIATLNRIAALWDRDSMAGAVVDRLIKDKWLRAWSISGYLGLATLTEGAADRLGLTLTYPEEEQSNDDPYWCVPELCPARYIVENVYHDEDGAEIKRSPTPWERIERTLSCNFLDPDRCEVVKMDRDAFIKLMEEARREAKSKRQPKPKKSGPKSRKVDGQQSGSTVRV